MNSGEILILVLLFVVIGFIVLPPMFYMWASMITQGVLASFKKQLEEFFDKLKHKYNQNGKEKENKK